VGNEVALLQSVSADARCVVSIIRSGDHYRFVEDRLVNQPATPTFDTYEYWSELSRSGIYDSIDAAREAAKIEFPQLSWA
jgi:hypothetical protein